VFLNNAKALIAPAPPPPRPNRVRAGGGVRAYSSGKASGS
jgi:hypothetical protein